MKYRYYKKSLEKKKKWDKPLIKKIPLYNTEGGGGPNTYETETYMPGSL